MNLNILTACMFNAFIGLRNYFPSVLLKDGVHRMVTAIPEGNKRELKISGANSPTDYNGTAGVIHDDGFTTTTEWLNVDV